MLLPLILILAATPPVVNSTKAGMDSEHLARIPSRMKTFVDRGTIAGAVTLIQRGGVLASLEAVGYADLESKKPMTADAVFQIMSMTKPITGVGVMILVEEGKLALSDPVEKHIPEFRGQWVIDSRDGDARQTQVAARRPVTVRDLMTHTNGMYGMPPETMAEAGARSKYTLTESTALASQRPLMFQPGAKWAYGNLSIGTLGRLIEIYSGLKYETFMKARLFDPLGMVDTYFYPEKEKESRRASAYALTDGKLRKIGELAGADSKYPFPEGGLKSTAADLAAFYQMMLDGGTYKGKRILSRASVEVMTAVHTGDVPNSPDWGLTWQLVRKASTTLSLISPGAYGHGGAYGTYGWVDPAKKLIGVFLVQRPGADTERNAFMTITNSAILE